MSQRAHPGRVSLHHPARQQHRSEGRDNRGSHPRLLDQPGQSAAAPDRVCSAGPPPPLLRQMPPPRTDAARTDAASFDPPTRSWPTDAARSRRCDQKISRTHCFVLNLPPLPPSFLSPLTGHLFQLIAEPWGRVRLLYPCPPWLTFNAHRRSRARACSVRACRLVGFATDERNCSQFHGTVGQRLLLSADRSGVERGPVARTDPGRAQGSRPLYQGDPYLFGDARRRARAADCRGVRTEGGGWGLEG